MLHSPNPPLRLVQFTSSRSPQYSTYSWLPVAIPPGWPTNLARSPQASVVKHQTGWFGIWPALNRAGLEFCLGSAPIITSTPKPESSIKAVATAS
ncbi:hypothetical protein AMR42_09025 [Limnothrix sp. PR1529]|nr:hypothetical protein AMR42_09025 [Limnothrix sp. PR1529]